MHNRKLGMIGIACAPFLFFDTLYSGFTISQPSQVSGVLNLIYMIGWVCSLIALKRMGAFGEHKAGRVIFTIQMTFLGLANGWNIYEIIRPGHGTVFYFILDV